MQEVMEQQRNDGAILKPWTEKRKNAVIDIQGNIIYNLPHKGSCIFSKLSPSSPHHLSFTLVSACFLDCEMESISPVSLCMLMKR